ncbi:hypothetical protein ACFX50_11035 [Neisseria meningitidis]
MKLRDLLMGIFLAVSAALLNATIGIFSKILMEQGLSVQHIAFLKTLTGFVFISILLCRTGFTETDCGYFKKERGNFAVAVKSSNLCFFRNLYVVFL